MESNAHSIHCSDDTSDSHELPPLAAAEGEHCILVWLGASAGIRWYHDRPFCNPGRFKMGRRL